MDLWLSREELMKVTGWKPRTVRGKVANRQIAVRDSGRKTRGRKAVLEYSAASLSPRRQARARQLVASRPGSANAPKIGADLMTAQLALFSPRPPQIQSIRLPAIHAHKVQIEAHYEAIAPLVELSGPPDDQAFPRRMPDGELAANWAGALAWCAAHSGKDIETIRRWYARFMKDGEGALLRLKRKDIGSGFFAAYRKAALLAAYLYLDCKQSFRAVHERMVRDAALIEVPPEDLPCYQTVRTWLRSMPPFLKTYAREGRKEYSERMAPYLKRGFTDVYANAVWVGDHMIHDVECANDLFEDAEWGAPIRLRLSAMLDFRSRMVTGASWAWEGSSKSIAATMRRGISKYGPPEHLYVDNGRDYKKVAKGARPGYLRECPLAPEGWWNIELDSIAATGFLARLGIAVTHCIPHHPQSKHVERFFKTLHEQFDKNWSTYTSGDPSTRPESTEKRMMAHRRLLRAGRAAESTHPLASEFILWCLAWMEEYADTPHEGEGMNGETPRQVFLANLNPDQKPIPDCATLTLLMAERERRQVRECLVTFRNHRYAPVDPADWAVMHEMNEREILVAYDSGDVENVAALDADGNFLAWLHAEELVRFAPYDAVTKARIGESMAIRRRLEKATSGTIDFIACEARANGATSPLEDMAARLRLPAGETGEDLVTQRRLRTAREPQGPRNRILPGEAGDRLASRKLRSQAMLPPTPAEAARMFLKRAEQETGSGSDLRAKEDADGGSQILEATA